MLFFGERRQPDITDGGAAEFVSVLRTSSSTWVSPWTKNLVEVYEITERRISRGKISKPLDRILICAFSAPQTDSR
jgi:hypothetical protein